MPKKSQVLALLELGWSYRRIEAETSVRRETVSRYDQMRRANAAKTFPGSSLRPRFAATIYRPAITEKLDAGLSLQRIWQDLVEEYGYGASYESVKRFVRTIAPPAEPSASFTAHPGPKDKSIFSAARRPWTQGRASGAGRGSFG